MVTIWQLVLHLLTVWLEHISISTEAFYCESKFKIHSHIYLRTHMFAEDAHLLDVSWFAVIREMSCITLSNVIWGLTFSDFLNSNHITIYVWVCTVFLPTPPPLRWVPICLFVFHTIQWHRMMTKPPANHLLSNLPLYCLSIMSATIWTKEGLNKYKIINYLRLRQQKHFSLGSIFVLFK